MNLEQIDSNLNFSKEIGREDAVFFSAGDAPFAIFGTAETGTTGFLPIVCRRRLPARSAIRRIGSAPAVQGCGFVFKRIPPISGCGWS